MISFRDISPGFRHPELIQHELQQTISQQTSGKGRKLLQEAFGILEADIYYMPNGTSSNLVAIHMTCLRSFEAVICVKEGHINNYETGGTEAKGHKILTVEGHQGKVTVTALKQLLQQYKTLNNQRVIPRLLYISQITELGTLYTFDGLQQLVLFCKEYNLYIYVDGARLAHAISSKYSNLTTQKFGQLGIDLFFVGATKNGGLGEALVINNNNLKKYAKHYIMQAGYLLKREELYDYQFERFFTNNLWLDLAKHANDMTQKLTNGLTNMNIKSRYDHPANHVFVPLSEEKIRQLKTKYDFSVYDEKNSHIARFVCGWSTEEEHIDKLLEDLES